MRTLFYSSVPSTACLLVAAGFPLAAQAEAPACSISAQPPRFEAAHSADGNPVVVGAHTGNHGQLAFGQGPFYLSHLAVFMGNPAGHPHNFQVILEVAFSDPAAEAAYIESVGANPGEIHTALPQAYDQAVVAAEELADPPSLAFPGTRVFLGHFEQGGRDITAPTGLDLERVVHFREFVTGGEPFAHPQYLLFGRANEMFLSRLISAPPDYQQVVRVEFTGEGNATDLMPGQIDQLLAGGLFLTLPERGNAVAERLKPEETLLCSVDTGTPLPLTAAGLHVVEEVYCEEGELSALVMGQFNRPARCAP